MGPGIAGCARAPGRLTSRRVLARQPAGRARALDLDNFLVGKAEHLLQNLVGVLAQQRRAFDLADAVGELDRIADAKIFAAGGMVELDHRAGLAQRRLLSELLHRQDRAARNVDRVADFHDLELGLGLGPLLDGAEDLIEMRQPRVRRGVVRMGDPFLLADDLTDLGPHRRLRDEIDIGVGITLPALAFEDPARLAAARGVAGAGHRVAELAVRVLRVFLERTMGEPLLVAQLDASEVEHAVLHGDVDALAAAGAVALIERAHDADCEVQAGAGIADLRAGHQWRPVVEPRGRCRAAGALRDVLVDLAVLIRARPEALDRSDDHPRIELLDVLPGVAHAVEHARPEILHQHVAALHQAFEHLLAFRMLGVERDRALVVVEHGVIQAVGVRHVAQLPAGDVAGAGALDLDHVGTEPGEQLGARRAGLHVTEIEDAHAVERFAGLAPRLRGGARQALGGCSRFLRRELHDLLGRLLRRRLGLRFALLADCHCASSESAIDAADYFLRIALCGLRLPMRPLSEPAAGSITALIRVGLPESSAWFTARLSSSGVVTWAPTPPNASAILS